MIRNIERKTKERMDITHTVNLNDLQTLKQTCPSKYAEIRDRIRERAARLEELYNLMRYNCTPREVAAAWATDDLALHVTAMAAMINNRVALGDGRISSDVAAWATSAARPNALRLSTKIHPAHLNQLARGMMEFERMATEAGS